MSTTTLTPEQRIAELEQKLAQLMEMKVSEAASAMPSGNWGTDPQAFATALAAAISASQGPKKVTFGEYTRRPSIGHPLGPKGPQFTREYFQNGFRLEWPTTPDVQIELLNKIDRSGRYFDRKVEVLVREDGVNESSVDIRFSNQTADQRFLLTGYFKTFTDMLQQIIAFQTAEDAEEDAQPVVRKTFGNTKAYREALAKRAAREAAATAIA